MTDGQEEIFEGPEVGPLEEYRAGVALARLTPEAPFCLELIGSRKSLFKNIPHLHGSMVVSAWLALVERRQTEGLIGQDAKTFEDLWILPNDI